MRHLRMLSASKPGKADLSVEEAEEFVNLVRSFLEMLRMAREVLGIPLPDKGAG